MLSSRAAPLLAVISLFTQHAIAVPAGPDQDVLSSSAVPLTSMDGLEDVRQKFVPLRTIVPFLSIPYSTGKLTSVVSLLRLKDAEIIPTGRHPLS
jgi:hypothetical protein